jgi:hypothetical protein
MKTRNQLGLLYSILMHRIRMTFGVVHLCKFFWVGGVLECDGSCDHLDDLMPACPPSSYTTMYKACKVFEIWVSQSSLLVYDAISVSKSLPSAQWCIPKTWILQNTIICSYKTGLIYDLVNWSIWCLGMHSFAHAYSQSCHVKSLEHWRWSGKDYVG